MSRGKYRWLKIQLLQAPDIFHTFIWSFPREENVLECKPLNYLTENEEKTGKENDKKRGNGENRHSALSAILYLHVSFTRSYCPGRAAPLSE